MADQREVIKVVIPNGGTTSAEVNVGARRIVGIQMPAAWTAGTISFEALVRQVGDTPTFGAVVDGANAAISIATPTADRYHALADTLALRGLGRIRVVAGAAQAAERTLYLVTV